MYIYILFLIFVFSIILFILLICNIRKQKSNKNSNQKIMQKVHFKFSIFQNFYAEFDYETNVDHDKTESNT